MKPILINLLAEEEQAERARARDPVKIVIALGTGLLAVAVATGGLMSGLALRSGGEQRGLEQQWRELAKQQAGGAVGAYRALKFLTDDLLEINRSRRLCAPQLAVIKDLVPDFVQLLRLSLTTSTVVRPTTAPPREDEDEAKAKIAQRQPPAAQVVTLQLEGKVTSPRPEDDLAKFQRMLETNATFGAQIAGVKLLSYGRISGPAQHGGPAVGQFVIECRYKEQP